jgi:putative transposase
MKRKRFTEEQIAFALRQAEAGTSVDGICRKLGVSKPTFHRWS